MMKARVNEPLLIPPGKGVGYMLGVGAEIMIQFIMKVEFWWGGKGREIVEDILR